MYLGFTNRYKKKNKVKSVNKVVTHDIMEVKATGWDFWLKLV